MSTAVVTINGLDFNGTPATGPRVVEWSVADVDGWSGPGGDLGTQPMASQDGDSVGRHRLRGRSLVVKGDFEVFEGGAYWPAYYALLGLSTNLVTPRVLIVHEAGAPKFVRYIRAGAVRHGMHDGLSLTFEIPLLCPDPRKYALEERTVTIPAGGSAVVTGLGSYPGGTPARVVTGGRVHLVNNVTGHALRTRTDVPAGTTFTPPTPSVPDSGTVKGSGGANLQNNLAPGYQWPVVVEGAQTITNLGTSTAELRYNDAYP